MMEKGAIFYVKHQDTYIIKLTGEIRCQLGCSFDIFLKRLLGGEDFRDIWLDLTEVNVIDSTCLGLLAKIAGYIRNRFNRKVLLFSTNPDIDQILEGVGFHSIFNIRNIGVEHGGDVDRIISCETDQSRLAATVYEAHLILSKLNDKNREMFKSIVEELKDRADSCPKDFD